MPTTDGGNHMDQVFIYTAYTVLAVIAISLLIVIVEGWPPWH